MKFIKIFFLTSTITILAGCPAKVKVLSYKLKTATEPVHKELLAAVGSEISATKATSTVGLKFMPDNCDHRSYHDNDENTLLGVCAIEKEITVYALLTDIGDDPSKYLASGMEKKTISMMDQFGKNAEAFLKKNRIKYQKEPYQVSDKVSFIESLKNE